MIRRLIIPMIIVIGLYGLLSYSFSGTRDPLVPNGAIELVRYP